ncbi:MAG: hypothetical protein EOP59_17505, partial [Sphingomonadales bacterium]
MIERPRYEAWRSQPQPSAFSPPPRGPNLIEAAPDRWSVSGWLVARAGRGIGAAPGGGQIGGGQAGVRVAYILSPAKRIAAFARITTPLAGEGREAAIGVEWQPSGAPLRIFVEQRFGLDDAPGGTGLGAVGGIDT